MKGKVMHKFVELLHREVVPAQGCTEPIAVAYAVSIAAEQQESPAEHIELYLSGNIVKNALGVGIPGTGRLPAGGYGRRDLWAVLPAASRLLGPGLGTCGCGGGTAAPGTAGTGPGAGRHGGREYRQRPNSGAAGLCPHRRPPQGFLPGGADAGYLGLRPPLGWSGGDRLTGTAPCNMKK